MANVTKKERMVTEGYTLELTEDEANGLRTLLYSGTAVHLLDNLGLRGVMDGLTNAGAGAKGTPVVIVQNAAMKRDRY